MDNTNEIELDLLELFHYLKKKVLIICIAFVVSAVLGFLVAQMFVTPKYTASTRMYVLTRTNEASVVYSDIQISTYLLNDYKVLITGQNVTKEVISKLGLDLTPAKLAGKIRVTAPENTRVLQIDVTDAQPQRAADIANCVQEVAASQIQEIMDVDAVKLVYEADVPEKPSSPNVLLMTVLAAALGTVAVMGIFVIIFIFDDTIRTEEDVEHYLGLSTMGVVPVSAELGSFEGRQPAGKHLARRKE